MYAFITNATMIYATINFHTLLTKSDYETVRDEVKASFNKYIRSYRPINTRLHTQRQKSFA